MNSRTPQFLITVSMIIFGTIGVFVKNIQASSAEIAMYRAILASLLIGLYLIFTGKKINLKKMKREFHLLLVSGAAMGINWILLFEAYKYTSVSIATLSYYFAPVIVMIACPFLFKEKISLLQIFCFIMSTIGLVMLTGIGHGGSNDLTGILLGLGAAVFYASVVIINKLIRNVDGIQRTFLQFVAAAAVIIPYVVLKKDFSLPGLNASGWINLLIVGIIHTGITYCMYFSALKDIPGQKAAILSYIDPLVAVIISVTVLNEKITILQIIGGILILGFTFINENRSIAERIRKQ